MPGHGIDTATAVRTARIALPCAAATLPLSMLTGNTALGIATTLLFVTGAAMLHQARGARIMDSIAALALAAELSAIPAASAPLASFMACVFSLSLVHAFLVASRIERSLEKPAKSEPEANEKTSDGLASA